MFAKLRGKQEGNTLARCHLYDTLRISNTSLLNVFNKRMDAVVSIFKNVEEAQLKPTKKMLESLFEGMEEKNHYLKKKIYL